MESLLFGDKFGDSLNLVTSLVPNVRKYKVRGWDVWWSDTATWQPISLMVPHQTGRMFNTSQRLKSTSTNSHMLQHTISIISHSCKIHFYTSLIRGLLPMQLRTPIIWPIIWHSVPKSLNITSLFPFQNDTHSCLYHCCLTDQSLVPQTSSSYEEEYM